MKNKGYIFSALIFLVCILSISAVSAADDIANDINADENQELNLEESNSDVSTSNNDIEELTTEENIKEDTSGNNNDKQELSAEEKKDSVNEKEKAETKTKENKAKATKTKKENKKTKKNAKVSSKKKSTFKTISKGSKDKVMVKKIQKALKKNGYYLSYKGHYLKIDGWYGPCTVRSVKQFQKAKKLKVTGKVDKKTAEKLKVIRKTDEKPEIIHNPNAIIKFENYKTFKKEYNDGYSFEVKIVKKSNGKGIATLLDVDYFKNGKKANGEEGYYTDDEGINYITPDYLEVGTYIAKVSCNEPKIKAIPKTRKIIITKTSISLKAENVSISSKNNIQLKAKLRFKNNSKVKEGKVKFTIDGKSYIVKVKNGVAIKNIKSKNLKSKQYKITFLGTKNIKSKSVIGMIG